MEFAGGGPPPAVVHERGGRAVHLVLHGSDLVRVEGMEHVYSIQLDTGGADLDLSAVEFYPAVELARFNLRGGGCDDLGPLGSWPKLRELFIREMHRFEPSSFPGFEESLYMGLVSLAALPSDLSAETKAHLKSKEFELSISRSIDPMFAGNPLNGWVDRNSKLGKRALREFAKAYKIAGDGDVEAGIKSFVTAINKMTNTFPIETLERDEAFEAVLLIGTEFGSAGDQVSKWFNEDRDF